MPPHDPDRPRRRARPAAAPVRPAPSRSLAVAEAGAPFRLEPVSATDGELTHEVALLRAAIRHLAESHEADEHVKRLAELRHQVGTLCTALKTQHALEGRDADGVSELLARALEEMGDQLGVPR